MSKIDKDVLEFSDKFQKGLSFDKDGQVVVEENLVAKCLPEGDFEKLKAAAEIRDLVWTGAAHAVGVTAEAKMKKDKDLSEVTVTVPVTGKDAFTYSYARNTQTSAPGSTEKKDNWGVLSGKMEIHSAANRRGEFGKVKAELAERGAKAFGG